MNTSIVGKQFDLTDPIKEYIENAFEAILKYNLDIISGKTVVPKVKADFEAKYGDIYELD